MGFNSAFKGLRVTVRAVGCGRYRDLPFNDPEDLRAYWTWLIVTR